MTHNHMRRRDFIRHTATAAAIGAFPRMGLAAQTSPDAEFRALLDTLFFERLSLSPINATMLGYDRGAHAHLRGQLDDVGGAARAKSLAWHRSALHRLNAFAPSALSQTALHQRELAMWYEERAISNARFGLPSVQQPYAISQRSGLYFTLPDFLANQHPVTQADDAEAYLARLQQFGPALDANTAQQEELAERDLIAPEWALDITLRQLRALRSPAPESNDLVQSLVRRTRRQGIGGDWSGRAAAILRDSLYPALDRQIAYVESLKGRTLPGDGIWRVKGGDAIYAAALADATTTTLLPDEVHKMGLAQVADLTARLDAALRLAGMTQGSVGERLAAFGARADQRYPNTDEGRAALLAEVNGGLQSMRIRLAQTFNDVPDDPVEIRRVPIEIQDGAASGYYTRAPLDRSRPAVYWINLRDTANWPKPILLNLAFHEGLPGHHLQLSCVNHAADLPLLLRAQSNTAYVEGWALYAEHLASDLGAYSGANQIGYLQSMLFRAARLVVDTGIHTKRWSRAKAIAYVRDTTGFTLKHSQSEVERYCCLIGEACAYQIGHSTWVRLREQARQELGDSFSLGWFHDVLKEGVMPMAILERRMQERIALAKT